MHNADLMSFKIFAEKQVKHSNNCLNNSVVELQIPTAILKTSFNSLPKWESQRLKLISLVEELEENFADTIQRQITFFELKHSIEELKNIVGLDNRGFLRVLNMLFDALHNTKSEKLNNKQVDTLKFVIKRLNENTDDFTATELEQIIMKSRLKPIPKIEGIADLFI